MNRTTTCNLSGLVFHIEEIGFEKLQNYLNEIREILKISQNSEEILEDIEARVAEIFSEKLHLNKQVITLEDVDQVIGQIGNPSDFLGEESPTEDQYSNEKRERILMRDPDNGVVAGVCLGLASYFSIDVVIVRVAFVVLTIISGFGILLYVLLWLFLQKATTAFDRLKMKGKPISAEGLEMEVKAAAQRIEKYADKWYKKNRGTGKIVLSNALSIIVSFIGVLIIFAALAGIIGFFTGALANVSVFKSDYNELQFSLYDMSNLIFDNHIQSVISWVGLVLVVVFPLLFLVVLGVSMIRKTKGKTIRNNFLFFFLIWIFGVVLLSITGVQLANSFSNTAESEELILEDKMESLYIQVKDEKRYDSENVKVRFSSFNNEHAIRTSGDTVKIQKVPVRVVYTNDSIVRVKLEKTASGTSDSKAFKRLNQVHYDAEIKGNTLSLPTYYWFPRKDKFRNQLLRVIIEVPNQNIIDWQGNEDHFDVSTLQRN